MGQPHKHAAVIKAWADGAEVQFRASPEHIWQDIRKPTWVDEGEYRVKPEAPKSTLTDGELTALLGGEDVLVSAIQFKRARKVADAAVEKFAQEQGLMYK